MQATHPVMRPLEQIILKSHLEKNMKIWLRVRVRVRRFDLGLGFSCFDPSSPENKLFHCTGGSKKIEETPTI